MTEQVRYRIDKRLIKEGSELCHELGLSPSQFVSLCFAQAVRVRGLPFRPSEFPALEEYGVTLEEITAAEDAALKEIRKDEKAGRLVKFTGKLPS